MNFFVFHADLPGREEPEPASDDDDAAPQPQQRLLVDGDSGTRFNGKSLDLAFSLKTA